MLVDGHPVYVGRSKMYNYILFVTTYIEYLSREAKTKHDEFIDYIGYDELKHVY